MRVIAGKARRIQLVTPSGLRTRPTTDRVKETLFNMLQSYLPDAAFLDLFCGSGAIGIEALSRGAEKAVFIENDREALDCVKKNLDKTGLKECAQVLEMDVFGGLKILAGREESFDVIFMDPPYNQEFEKRVLEELKSLSLITEDTLIIFEASLETDIQYLEQLGYLLVKEKKYKTNKHVFVRLA